MDCKWSQLSPQAQSTILNLLFQNIPTAMASQGVSNSLYGLFKMGCKWYDLSSIHKDAIQAGIIRVSKDMNEQEVSNIIYR